MDIGNLLNVSSRGLLSNQQALRVTSHNIANVNTPGFSRQRAELSSTRISSRTNMGGGGGVEVAQVKRIVNTMVENRLTIAKQELGRLSEKEVYLPLVEEVFNEIDDGSFSERMDAFFTHASELSQAPQNFVGREDVLRAAQDLPVAFKESHTRLTSLSREVDQQITSTLEDINRELVNLQTINKEIVRNANAPDMTLLDKRTNTLNDLSRLIDFQILNEENDALTLMTNGGKLLVNEGYVAEFSRGGVISEGEVKILGIQIDGANSDVTETIESGALKGLIEIRDEVLNVNGDNGVIKRFKNLADEMRFQVNKIHSQSVGKNLGKILSNPGDQGHPRLGRLGEDLSDLISGAELIGVGDRVQQGTLKLAYGDPAKPDNLSVIEVANVVVGDPEDDTVQSIIDRINTAALNDPDITSDIAALDSNNRLQLTGENGNAVAVIEDTSNVMVRLGFGIFFTGSTINDMAVAQGVLTDPNTIGTGRIRLDSTDSTKAIFDNADNNGAIALSDLRSQDVSINVSDADVSATLQAHYADIVSHTGSIVKGNHHAMTSVQTNHEFLEDYRENFSGVSLEEEMTNLMRFQRAFQAASKLITSADELMQTLLNMV